MLPGMASLNNTPLSSGEDVSNGFAATTSSNFRRHSLECVPSSSSASRSWFHGEMSKIEAEDILKNCEQGSFLVRMEPPSKYSSVKYYISLSTPGETTHMPIRTVTRQFYFMGEAYSSLPELVSAFQATGAEPVSSGHSLYEESLSSENAEITRYICICTVPGDHISEEISAMVGDIISGLEDVNSDWILARNERTGCHGYIPCYALSTLLGPTDDIADLPYFHNPVAKDALHRLVETGPGSFFLRCSSRGEGTFALLVHTRGGQVEKFLIRRTHDTQGGYALAGRRFSTVQQIIERYCRFPIIRGLRLTHAVLATPTESSESSFLWSSETTPEEEHRSITDAVVATTSRTIASIQALRKSREEKPWKPCWITLRDDPQGSCQLIISDDPTSSRVRLTLDLPFSTIYLLDESVFGRDSCIFLSQNDIDVPGVFLCLRPFPVFAEWITLLRPRTLGLQPGAIPTLNGLKFELPKPPNIALLKVFIDKFRAESLKTEGTYSAYGSINGVKVCSTQLLLPSSAKTMPTLVFDSSFLIPFTPAGAGSFQVTLMSHSSGKKNRPFSVSPLFALPEAELISYEFEQGFSLRIARNSIAVASERDYHVLREWLERPSVEFLEFVSDSLSTQDRNLLCLSLVSSLIPQPRALLAFIGALLSGVLASAAPENVLRQDSLATCLLTHTLRIAARSTLETSLEKSGISNSRVPDTHDVESAVSCVISLAGDVIVAHVMALVKRLAEERFGDQKHVVRRVLSAVVILRFANPLLLASFQGLPMGQFLAKGVQSAANTACARNATADEMPHITALRNLFDSVGSSLPTLPPVSPVGRDWMAVAGHLMYSAISSKAGVPSVPDDVLRVLGAHKSATG